MKRSALAVLLVAAASNAPAQSPEITRILPTSGSAGEKLPFVLEGKNLANPKSLWTDFPASVEWNPAQPDKNKLQGTITLPTNPTSHTGFLHLTTQTGLSNPLLFLVDDLPVLRKNAPGKLDQALPVPVPHAVAGHTDTAEPEFFRITLTAGQSVSIEVHAARIGSRLDPKLRLLDPSGVICASIDDTPGLAGDCRIRFTAKQTGDHFIELRDSAFNGGPDLRYHLRIGDFPLVDSVYPPLAKAGTRQTFHALPATTPASPPITLELPNDPSLNVPTPFRFSANTPASLASVRLTDSPVIAESIDSTISESQPALTETCVVVGRLSQPKECDAYSLSLKKDDRIFLDPLNREIGSAATLHFSIHHADGTLLTANDPQGQNLEADAPLSFKAPKDGLYQLRVEDAARRGHPSLIYAFHFLKNPAPFEISVASDRFIAPKGGSFTSKVTAQRKGMNEPITVHVEGFGQTPLPHGTRFENNVIEKGKNDTTLRVTLPNGLPEGSVQHIQFRATAHDKDTEWSALASLKADGKKNNQKKTDALTLALAAMPQPPRRLTEAFPLCVGPEAPDFFKIELTDRGALLPRSLGKSQFVLRQTALDKSFDGNAQIRFENLPEGITITSSGARGGRIAGQVDFVCDVNGPTEPASSELSFDIVASADFKGAFKEVRLKKVPLHLVEPVEIAASLPPTPLKPGSSTTLTLNITRHDAANPTAVEIALEGLPPGITPELPLKPLPAGESSLTVPLTISPNANEGTHQGLVAIATSIAGGKPTKSRSTPIQLEIKR
jgi:hypothetical protein